MKRFTTKLKTFLNKYLTVKRPIVHCPLNYGRYKGAKPRPNLFEDVPLFSLPEEQVLGWDDVEFTKRKAPPKDVMQNLVTSNFDWDYLLEQTHKALTTTPEKYRDRQVERFDHDRPCVVGDATTLEKTKTEYFVTAEGLHGKRIFKLDYRFENPKCELIKEIILPEGKTFDAKGN